MIVSKYECFNDLMSNDPHLLYDYSCWKAIMNISAKSSFIGPDWKWAWRQKLFSGRIDGARPGPWWRRLLVFSF